MDDAFFTHRLHRCGVHPFGRHGPGGADLDLAFGKVLEVGGGHLRASGVVDADEQDGGFGVHGLALQRQRCGGEEFARPKGRIDQCDEDRYFDQRADDSGQGLAAGGSEGCDSHRDG